MGNKVRSVVCAPIVLDGNVLGVVEAVNKQHKGKSPKDLSSLQAFSANDMLLLSFIATNMALVLKQSGLSQSLTSLNGGVSVSAESLSKKLQKLEGDHSLQRLIEFAYNKLDAERVSIFTYSASSKSLVCTVSQDIKGFTIPSDKGFAGLSFSAMRVINVPDTTSDQRHNKDVDNYVGFHTRNLLCAPIISQEGIPLGVIQAVNKKSGRNFSFVDEEQIDEVCKMMVAILREKADENKSQSASCLPTSSSFTTLELARSVGSITLSANLGELVLEVERTLEVLLGFDYVGVYIVDGDRMFRMPPVQSVLERSPSNDSADEAALDQWTLAELPLQLKQALQFNAVVEYKFNALDGNVLLPNVSLTCGYVLPVQGKAYPFQPGACVLIVGNSRREMTMTDSIKESLNIVVEYFGKTLNAISDKYFAEEQSKTLRQQLHMLQNAVAAVEDYVVLLAEDGSLITSNKNLEELVGLQSNEQGEKVKGIIRDGTNYKDWLTAANSPQLIRDIKNALTTGESKDARSVRFSSAVYTDGINVDYRVAVVNNPTASPSFSSEQIHSPSYSPAGSVSESVEQYTKIVMVSIHVNSRNTITIEQAVSTAHSKKSDIEEFASATSGVDVASQILASISANFNLDPEVEASLKQTMSQLSYASRRMSITNSAHSAISLALHAINYPLVNPSVELPANIFEWEFNVLPIKDSIVLCNIIGKFFDTLFAIDEMNIDPSTLARYIVEVGKHYHDRPFHNLQHSTCVTHFTFMLINATAAPENLSQYQVFAILLSAVVHDVDHPGNTNLFEVNSGSDLAIRYNDHAVLENHHVSTAFRLMKKPNLNVLGRIPKNIASDIRKTVISCVMATDMAVHFELIDETKKRAREGWNFSEAKDQALLGKILLHAADLSNPVRPFHMTRQWAERISVEFNDQVAREQALGMPFLGFMFTPDEKSLCKNETTFANFVVAPMWRALSTLYPNLVFLVEQLDSNLSTWKGTLEKILAEEEAAAARAAALGES